MNELLKKLLDDFTAGSYTSSDVLSDVEESCGISFPEDYRSFFLKMNGGEGFIGEEYLILWKVDELEQFNKEYEVEKYAPGLFLFASNGGGEGFAFDTRSLPFKVVQVPFIGMDLQHATPVADSFLNLFERMYQSDGSLL